MNSLPQDDQLIPIREHDGQQAISGRDLHQFLEVGAEYRHWFPRMTEYGFIEGQDYAVISDRVVREGRGTVERKDHALTLDMAKEVAMIQRTVKGKQARQYFIECERQAQQQNPDLDQITRLDLARMIVESEQSKLRAEKRAEALQSYAGQLEPKAEAYDHFMDADGTYSVGAVAKMLGLSQNKLFDRLRNTGVLIAKGAMRNTPYQHYMHHFSVKAYEFERSDGTRGTSYTTRVQPSGVDFVRRKLGIPAGVTS